MIHFALEFTASFFLLCQGALGSANSSLRSLLVFEDLSDMPERLIKVVDKNTIRRYLQALVLSCLSSCLLAEGAKL